MRVRIEFGSKAMFVTIAESLGVAVGEIFSAIPSDEHGVPVAPVEATAITVIYQPGVTAENYKTQPVYRVLLVPHPDGNLYRAGEPDEIPDFFPKFAAAFDVNMKEDDGER